LELIVEGDQLFDNRRGVRHCAEMSLIEDFPRFFLTEDRCMFVAQSQLWVLPATVVKAIRYQTLMNKPRLGQQSGEARVREGEAVSIANRSVATSTIDSAASAVAEIFPSSSFG
jgi:hypothetical protein